jgi:manganese transport protein
VIIALGWDPTQVLVVSQVTLSFVLPIPVISLVLLTRRPDLMGSLANRPITNVLATACTAIILLLNGLLIYITLGGTLPGGA